MSPTLARLVVLVALLAPAAARSEDARGWSVVSPNADYEATQRPVGDAGCRVEVKRGERTLVWAADRCFGTADDLYFLSNNGEGLIVFRTFPAKANDKAAGMKAALGVEVFAKGERVAGHAVGSFVADTRPLVNAKRHFYWIEGALGQPGVPPGPSKDAEAIEFSTLDRKSWSVGFNGKTKKVAAPKPLDR